MLLHCCILLLVLVVNSGTSSAYRPIPRPLSTIYTYSSTHSHRIHHQSASQLNAVVPGSSEDTSLLLSLLLKASPGQSKVDFYFFFFGGSGALGIGLARLPKLFSEFQLVQSFKGGASKGGDDLSISPLATIGYPESLKVADIEYILDNMPTAQQIADNGLKKSYMSQLGYLERAGFYKCLPDANPLALYAAFDALAKGGGDLVAPRDLNEAVTRWRAEGDGGPLDQFSSDLLQATAKKYSAYSVFFLLLALVFDLIVESGVNAFL